MDIENRKKLLADYLEVDVDELSVSDYDENIIKTNDGEEYLVLDEYEAEDYARRDIESFIDDVGITGFTPGFQDWIANNAIDIDWFNDAMRESNMSYVEDIESEDDIIFENRLIQEMFENGLLDDDDLYEDEEDGTLRVHEWIDLEAKKEELVDRLDGNYPDGYEWYMQNFGEEEIRYVINEHNLIDIDKVVEECITWDGIAHFIARYDGEEIELEDNMYAYRVN